jgi:hypothetical protein
MVAIDLSRHGPRQAIPVLASTLGLLALVSAADAQSVPPRRAHHALGYDENRQRVVLTGGSTPTDGGRSFTFFNDLWEFDGARWVALPPSGERISGMRLAFDRKQNRLFSFGGFKDGISLAALRVREGHHWQSVGQAPAMPAAEPGFVYDTARERLIAFGGSAGRGQANGDTWEFDGTSWTRFAGPNPPPRASPSMVYDEKRSRTVLFGGMGRGGAPGQRPGSLADTWEFDGTAWAQRQVTGPTARQDAGAAYDSKRGLVILFGGAGPGGFKGDTWSWDGGAWKRLATTGPEPRAMGHLAYDQRRNRIVLFGGRKGYPNGDLNDTWEWDGTRWKRIGS